MSLNDHLIICQFTSVPPTAANDVYRAFDYHLFSLVSRGWNRSSYCNMPTHHLLLLSDSLHSLIIQSVLSLHLHLHCESYLSTKCFFKWNNSTWMNEWDWMWAWKESKKQKESWENPNRNFMSTISLFKRQHTK